MSRQAYWLNQDVLDELYPSYAIHSLINEFRFRGVLVPVVGPVYQRCPTGCDLGLLELGDHNATCDTCMGMGFVEIGEEQT